MSSGMKAELAVSRQVDVAGRRRIPDARAVAKSDRALQLLESEGLSVERTSTRFVARRIKHLRVMQGNPHKFESRRAEIQCFSCFSWAIIYSTRRRCRLGDRTDPDDDRDPTHFHAAGVSDAESDGQASRGALEARSARPRAPRLRHAGWMLWVLVRDDVRRRHRRG